MLNVTFLGTAGSLPTPERNPSAILINREGEMILFDCGEGTQRQMMRARTGMMRLNYIFLTHLHADHILGIPGLLETMAFQGRDKPLIIAGPIHTKHLLETFKAVCYFSRNFDVKAVEMGPGDVLKMDGYLVEAIETNHSVPSLGYCLKEDMRLGRFDRDAAISLGIPPGPLFGKSIDLERDNAFAWYELAQAYARMGQTARAELATAERYFALYAFPQAIQFAGRAQRQLPPGSTDWQRASDIIAVATSQQADQRGR